MKMKQYSLYCVKIEDSDHQLLTTGSARVRFRLASYALKKVKEHIPELVNKHCVLKVKTADEFFYIVTGFFSAVTICHTTKEVWFEMTPVYVFGDTTEPYRGGCVLIEWEDPAKQAADKFINELPFDGMSYVREAFMAGVEWAKKQE